MHALLMNGGGALDACTAHERRRRARCMRCSGARAAQDR